VDIVNGRTKKRPDGRQVGRITQKHKPNSSTNYDIRRHKRYSLLTANDMQRVKHRKQHKVHKMLLCDIDI